MKSCLITDHKKFTNAFEPDWEIVTYKSVDERFRKQRAKQSKRIRKNRIKRTKRTLKRTYIWQQRRTFYILTEFQKHPNALEAPNSRNIITAIPRNGNRYFRRGKTASRSTARK